MKTLLIVALIVTGALAVGQGNRMMTYSDFDSNGNNKITKQEFESVQQARKTTRAKEGRMMRNAKNMPTFSDIDTNNDGNIDKQEFQAHQATQQAKNRGNNRRGQGANR